MAEELIPNSARHSVGADWVIFVEIRQAKYFLAMCKALNFTRAAESCGVTQPALTRAIQQLEREIGGQLFGREGRRTHLTNLGREIRPRVEELIDSTVAINLAARKYMSTETSAVRLGIMCTVGAMRIMAFLNEFLAVNPTVNFTLREGMTSILVERLLNDEIDVAILPDLASPNRHLDAHPLYSERSAVAVPLGHRFWSRDVVSLRDLDGERYLSRVDCEFQSRLVTAAKAHAAEIHEICRSEREDWMQLLARAGAGIFFLPAHSAVIPGLRIIPLSDSNAVRRLSAFTVSGRQLSIPAAKLIQDMNCYRWTAEMVANAGARTLPTAAAVKVRATSLAAASRAAAYSVELTEPIKRRSRQIH